MNGTAEARAPYALDDDQAYYHERLEEDAPTLFKDSTSDGIEVLHTTRQGLGNHVLIRRSRELGRLID